MATETKPKYFDIERHELVACIPGNGNNVLDVGCGSGVTIRLVKDLGYDYVAGIEVNPDQAKQAERYADKIHLMDLNWLTIQGPGAIHKLLGRKFDAVIMGDILEHLPYCGLFLLNLREVLTPDSVIIISIPNMGWLEAVDRILNQSFLYDADGHFDQAHMRFFCRDDIRRLVEDAGYEVLKLEPVECHVSMPEYRENMTFGFHNWQVFNITRDHYEQLYAYQWLCVAKVKA